jgi:hypothetical protein
MDSREPPAGLLHEHRRYQVQIQLNQGYRLLEQVPQSSTAYCWNWRHEFATCEKEEFRRIGISYINCLHDGVGDAEFPEEFQRRTITIVWQSRKKVLIPGVVYKWRTWIDKKLQRVPFHWLIKIRRLEHALCKPSKSERVLVLVKNCEIVPSVLRW